METKEKILTHISLYGEENKYRLATALKIDVSEATEALDVLEKEGKIEMKEGKAFLAKKKPVVEVKQEIEKIQIEEEVRQERIKGTVKFYRSNKGFGFIRGDDGQEYRVNESGLKEGFIIKADDRVSFKVFQGHKGPEADDVEAVNLL